jgi:hypothetical protein
MSAVSDRAKDFWDRISSRERKLVVLAAFAAPLTIAIWLGLQIQDGLDAKERNNERMRKALVIVADLKARGPTQPVDDVVATMGTEPLSLDTYLDNAAKKAGFTIKGTTPHNPVTKNGFVTNSVSLNVDDLELEKLKVFLQELETASKVVVVTHLDMKRDFKDKAKVDAKLEVSTYSKEAPAKAEGSGSDAKKGG